MKNSFTSLLAILVLTCILISNCAKEEPVINLEADSVQLLKQDLNQMSDWGQNYDVEAFDVLDDYYASLNECGPVDEEESGYFNDFAQSLGFTGYDILHDWVIDFGSHVGDIIDEHTPDDEHAFLSELTSQLLPNGLEQLSGDMECTLSTVVDFEIRAHHRSDNFNTLLNTGEHLQSISCDPELYQRGSSLYRVFRTVKMLEACKQR